jgi:glycogen debranching enzyme
MKSWERVASLDRALRVVKRLLQPEMWSGWGIRTLSSENPAYNPFSYYCGSIWPHDNGIIAMGLKRYGFTKEVERVAQGMIDAAGNFESFRLPELYAGIDRQPGSFPVPYSDANVPQAWAAASVFQLLQAILGLRADAPNRRFYINPDLPNWLPEITLRRIQVGTAQIDIKVWRSGEHTYWDITANTDDIEVIQQSWQPWQFPE